MTGLVSSAVYDVSAHIMDCFCPQISLSNMQGGMGKLICTRRSLPVVGSDNRPASILRGVFAYLIS